MLRFLSFAKKTFHRIPLPHSIKEQLKAIFFALFHLAKLVTVPAGVSKQGTEIDQKDRKQKLLSHISPMSQIGLEIGPLSSPIVTKHESSGQIFYVDYTTADELRQVYRNEPSIKAADIVNTDYVWGDKSLAELVLNKRFDYVLASHVIEHVPDMLGWLKEIAEVLENDGILSLAVPDKRYTFDYFRELSTPGMLIEAYLSHRRRPGIQSIFDYVALTGKIDLVAAWKETINIEDFQPTGTFEQAYRFALDSLNSNRYLDAHVNVFTSGSFLQLLEIASRLGVIEFIIVDFHDTAHNTFEFFVSLKRVSRNLGRHEILALQLAGFAKAREQLNKSLT